MPDLPFGTVTFLFTDIEGSTRLWEEHPDAMRLSLARHDSLLRTAIESEGGVVFKTIGDAFCAAFPNATRALDAALLGQQHLCVAAPSSLQRHLELKVRMALHTGEAEIRDGDYFGPPLNRVARLLATGHGGQVLLSAAAQELVRDDLPAGASLATLGSHRLRDLARPEDVFQLLHSTLPGVFPPLRSLTSFPNNLPQQATSFVGREKELAQVRELLGETRLLTLAGMGGTGKTRLALQAAADLLPDFPDGVFLVELGALTDPGLVAQTTAGVVGIKEAGGMPILETLAAQLKEKALLLLLDNCEHLLSACVPLVVTLLRETSGVKLLCTSREGLNVPGETTLRVPSLSVPEPRRPVLLASLGQYEAVRLFVERARAAQPSFQVTTANAPAVAQICWCLDGIPLALELAAARIKSLSPERLLARLDDRFRILVGGSHALLPRHQTLRALIDWSYDTLEDREQILLQRLAVFAGGWTLEAAEAVCGSDDPPRDDSLPIPPDDVLDLLSGLVEKSLVVYEERQGAERYRLFETIREYALERLGNGDEAAAIRTQHREHFLGVAAESEAGLRGTGLRESVAAVVAELDNLRAALEWSLEEPRGMEVALRLAVYLGAFWSNQGYHREGRGWFERALQRAEGGEVGLRWQARGLADAAWFTAWSGKPEAAQELAERAVRTAAEFGDPEVMVVCATALGNVLRFRGNLTGAREVLRAAVTHAARLPPGARYRAVVSAGLGMVESQLGNYEPAAVHLTEAVRLLRSAGLLHSLVPTLNLLSDLAWRSGDYPHALETGEECLVLSEQLDSRQERAWALNAVGNALRELGNLERAGEVLAESLREQREMGDINGVIQAAYALALVHCCVGRAFDARPPLRECLLQAHALQTLDAGAYVEVAADLAALAPETPGQCELAVRLTAAAAALREAVGQGYAVSERQANEQRTTTARKRLGDAEFQREWEAGSSLEWDGALRLALEACGDA